MGLAKLEEVLVECKECKVHCKVQGVQAAGTKGTLLPAVSQTISVPMIIPDFWQNLSGE